MHAYNEISSKLFALQYELFKDLNYFQAVILICDLNRFLHVI